MVRVSVSLGPLNAYILNTHSDDLQTMLQTQRKLSTRE